MVDDHAMTLRHAAVSDAVALAELHMRAWQWAYRGQMPDALLADLAAGLEQRAAWWRGVLGQEASEERTWVAEAAGRIRGFASTGPSHAPDAVPGTAVLYALYLDPACVGHGLGRSLLTHALSDLRRRGYTAATLWVLASNERARRFYAAGGWQLAGTTRIEQLPGAELPEVQYRLVLG